MAILILTLTRLQKNYLWWNDKINIGNNPVNYKHWWKNGVYFVNDLLAENGSFLSYNEFCNLYNVRTNVIEYHAIINVIKNEWPRITNGKMKVDQPFKPIVVDLLVGQKQGCKLFYELLLKNVNVTHNTPSKWQNELNIDIAENLWQKICVSPIRITKDTRLQWFQFRLLNNILGTNVLLYKMKLKDNDLCSFCNSAREDVLHLFYNCDTVGRFLKELQLCIKNKIIFPMCNIKITLKNLMLGTTDDDDALNIVLLLTKFHIYKARLQNIKPNLKGFIYELESYINSERFIARSNQKLNIFEKKWNVWKDLCN